MMAKGEEDGNLEETTPGDYQGGLLLICNKPLIQLPLQATCK